MSFGYGTSDFIAVTQLAWRAFQGAREACGEHDELTREVRSLHTVLQRARDEIANPDSMLSRCSDERREELETHILGCETILKVIDTVLTKYNALGDDKQSGKRLWQKVKFGNGETKDLAEIRLKICTHTQAIMMSLNLLSLGSQGRMEVRLNSLDGDVQGIRESVNWIVAGMAAAPEASVMTSYTNDSKAFWRELRRELVKDGYTSSMVLQHKSLIKAYIKELGDRGVLDEPIAESLVLTQETQLLQQSSTTSSKESHSSRNNVLDGDLSNKTIIRTQTEVSVNEIVSIEIPTGPSSSQASERSIFPVTETSILSKEVPHRVYIVEDCTGEASQPKIKLDAVHEEKVETTHSTLDESGHMRRSSNMNPENRSSALRKFKLGPAVQSATVQEEGAQVVEVQCKEKDQNVGIIAQSSSHGLCTGATIWPQISRTQLTRVFQPPVTYHSKPHRKMPSYWVELINEHERRLKRPELQNETNDNLKAEVTYLVTSEVEAALYSLFKASNNSENPTSNAEQLASKAGLFLGDTAGLSLSEEVKRSIRFVDCLGEKYLLPWDIANSWQKINSFIQQAFPKHDKYWPQIHAGIYNLVDSLQGVILWPMLPYNLESRVHPGHYICMVAWPLCHPTVLPDSIPERKTIGEVTSSSRLSDSVSHNSTASSLNDANETEVTFEDCLGRKFQFPWAMCNTWETMRGLIEQAFIEFEGYQFLLQKGSIQILDPNGKIIAPEDWGTLVQPGWKVTMTMKTVFEQRQARIRAYQEILLAESRNFRPFTVPIENQEILIGDSSTVPPDVIYLQSRASPSRKKKKQKYADIVWFFDAIGGPEKDW